MEFSIDSLVIITLLTSTIGLAAWMIYSLLSIKNLDFNPREEWEYMTSDTFEKWDAEFKKEHPIRHWVDGLLGDRKTFLTYSLSYSLLHPWKIGEDIYNQFKWAWQRVFRGWDDRVIWSIDYHLAEMIPLWLTELKKDKHGVPNVMFSENDYEGENYDISDDVLTKRESQYNAILDGIITGFICYKKMSDCEYKYQSSKWKSCERLFEEGFDLFKKYFGTLWD